MNGDVGQADDGGGEEELDPKDQQTVVQPPLLPYPFLQAVAPVLV